MRILYHQRTSGTDAQAVHILEIVRALRALGHTVDFASLVAIEDVRPSTSHDAEPGGWQGRIRRIPFAYDAVQLFYNVAGLGMLSRLLFRDRYDFIYERYALLNFSGVLAGKITGKPIFLEVNSPLADEQYAEKLIRIPSVARWFEKHICNAATVVQVVSSPLRDILIRNGVRAEKIVVTPNGVDLSRYQDPARIPPSTPQLDGKLVIGFTGWFKKWHGLDLLLSAFELVRKVRDDCALLLIGNGPAMEELQTSVKDKELQSSVLFAGPVPNADVPSWLLKIDVAVQPAANLYCCPMKIIEYMGAGRTICAPRQPNVLDVLQDGVNARLFEPGSVRSLSAALLELASDAGLRKTLASCALRSVSDLGLLWSRNAERIVQAIQPGQANRSDCSASTTFSQSMPKSKLDGDTSQP